MNEFETQKGTVKENVSTLVDQGHQTVDAIKARVSDVKTQVRDNSAAMLDKTRGYVSEHPLKALGIAFGLGYAAMRVRTSFIMELAFLAGFGYVANRFLKLNADAPMRSSSADVIP